MKVSAVHRSELEALIRGQLAATPMQGGASTRRYFRVTLRDGSTAVAIHAPDGAKTDEAHRPYQGTRWPFLEVRDVLAAHGVDVPHVLAVDESSGWVVIEDLGEETLAKWLLKNPSERERAYRQVISDLVRAQRKVPIQGSIFERRPFDEAVARWELDHFREWALEARGMALSAEDAAIWHRSATAIATRVAALPRTFMHRDYQSRNIMVHGERRVWIDFQDAVCGPRVYDLASLLNDSYQDFDRAFIDARLRDYANEANLDEAARATLAADFDLLTVQRKLKDAGRFVFLEHQRHKPLFSKFVTPTIKKAARALERLENDAPMSELRALLGRVLGAELDS